MHPKQRNQIKTRRTHKMLQKKQRKGKRAEVGLALCHSSNSITQRQYGKTPSITPITVTFCGMLISPLCKLSSSEDTLALARASLHLGAITSISHHRILTPNECNLLQYIHTTIQQVDLVSIIPTGSCWLKPSRMRVG